MANQCYNILSYSGDEGQIEEFLKLMSCKDNHYKNTGWKSNFIDCRGMVSKSKESKNTEVKDFIKKEISENKYIGYETEFEDGQINFQTDWSPYVTPLLYISNLFPLISFELFYDEPNNQFEGRYEFIDGNLLTDFCLSKEDRGWELSIYKTKFKTIDGFKKYYGMNRLRNINVKVHEENTY